MSSVTATEAASTGDTNAMVPVTYHNQAALSQIMIMLVQVTCECQHQLQSKCLDPQQTIHIMLDQYRQRGNRRVDSSLELIPSAEHMIALIIQAHDQT